MRFIFLLYYIYIFLEKKFIFNASKLDERVMILVCYFEKRKKMNKTKQNKTRLKEIFHFMAFSVLVPMPCGIQVAVSQRV